MRFSAASKKDLELIVVPDHEATGKIIADSLRDMIGNAPSGDLSVFFATGSTPMPAYRRLVEMHRQGAISFRKVNAFTLDEYYDLAPSDPHSFRNVIKEALFDHVDLPAQNMHFFDTVLKNPEKICRLFEGEVKQSGGIDAMILGIGSNGHIAFNEPGTTRSSRTRLIDLTEETRNANARFFKSAGRVPKQAFTVGIGNILEARNVLLIATGAGKAAAIERSLSGPVTPDVPASFLQELEGGLTVVLDYDAAARLDLNVSIA